MYLIRGLWKSILYPTFSKMKAPSKLILEITIIAMSCLVHNIQKTKIYVNNTTKGRRGHIHTINTVNKNKQNKEIWLIKQKML